MTNEGRSRSAEGAEAAGEEVLAGAVETTDAEEAVGASGATAPDATVHEHAGNETAAGAVGTEEDDQPPDAAQTGPHASDSEEAPSAEEALIEALRTAQEHLDRALRAEDEVLRARAETENVRRRMARDVEGARKFALERFVSDLLPVKDSLEAGLDASVKEGASAAGIAEGIELTLRMLVQAMEKSGVEVVDPAGQPFDPQFHQAMTMQESDTAESGTVLTVVQKGCLLNERLVRPAMVIVAK